MTLTEGLILAAYFFILCILAVYGWHRYYLVFLYMRHRQNVPGPLPEPDPLPVVTVQLPIYNEMYVVNRLIESILAMDYPRHLLEIQVLDDSTDETSEIAELAVLRHAEQGFDIKYIHRVDRTGYKAGALDAGLKVARGEFVAIFDADFVAPADFLRRTVPQFADPKVGMVQARWGHINRDYSLLTRVQAILLDGHFVLEHGSRNRAGCFFNFNGTAGIWRTNVIADAGGWQHDTLTEDLDLSYRAQLRGWKFVFLQDLVSPAEVPVEMNAFKSQQHRWAKGSIQTCRKLLPRILQSDLPLLVKAEAFFHLTANFNYLLMVLLSLLMFPSMYVRYNMGWTEMMLIDVPLFFAATFSVFNFYMVCQRELFPDTWKSRLQVPAVRDVDRHRAVHQQRPRGDRGADAQGERRVRPHPEVRHRARLGRLAGQEVPPDRPGPAADRVRPRPLLHDHRVLRARQRHLRDAAVPRALPGRLPLHRPALDRPAVRRRRHGAAHAGGG